MNKKYLLKGDYIQSKNDGDLHYISAPRLCDLYQLDPGECIFSDFDRRKVDSRGSSLIVLGPRVDGDYAEHLREVVRKLERQGIA